MEDKYCNNCQRQISAANFATHSAFCERNIKVCKICNEPISISLEENHLNEFHVTIPCDLCNILLEKWMLPKHQESCTKRPITCEYCDGEFPFVDFSEHFEFCSSRTEKCLMCKKYIMLKDKQKHSEIHLCEKKLLHANIDKEVKQNIINEVMSNSTASKNIEEKVDEIKNCNISSDKIIIDKDRVQVPEGASASVITKEMSKHYTTCYICNQKISWIDMNTHIPACASNAGKCSRCGDQVPDHEIKDHILKNCKMLIAEDSLVNKINKTDIRKDRKDNNVAFYVAEIDEQDMKSCPFCKQLCSTERIVEHMKNCCENCYECPMCNLKVVEKDKIQHETFDCSRLLDTNHHMSYSAFDASKNTHEKYKNSPNVKRISKDKITKEESNSLNIGNATRKSTFQKKEKNSNQECEPCCPCRKNSKHKLHSHICQKNEKRNCFYCFEEINVKDEDFHLSKCKAFPGNENDRLVSSYERGSKGAVPKNSAFYNMVKSQEVRCTFCNELHNADLVFDHKKICIHQPFECEECNGHFPLKDLESHICKSKKGKGNKGRREKNQTNVQSGLGSSLFQNIFRKHNNSDKNTVDCSENSPAHRYDYSVDPFSHADIDDVKIPCEFCGKLCSTSDIVLHQTGCEPELVALPKNSQGERTSESAKQSNMFQQDADTKEKFFMESKQNIPTSRSQNLRRYKESDAKPGEFLQTVYNKTSETSENNQQTGVNDYNSSSSIKSVWNVNSENMDNSETEKEFENENSDEEMSEMLEFIHEDEPESKRFCEFDKSSNNLCKEAMEILSKSDNDIFDLNEMKDHVSAISSDNKKTQAFTLESGNCASLKKEFQNYVEDMQSTMSEKSYFEISEDDLKKLEKWQNRKPSKNS